MSYQSLYLPVTLHHCRACGDDCAECLRRRLGDHQGVAQVDVVEHLPGIAGRPGMGTIHFEYDPALLSLADINAMFREAGSCIGDQLAYTVFRVEGMTSPQLAQQAQARLEAILDAPVRAIASYPTQSIHLEWDRSRCILPQVVDRLDTLGIRVASLSADTPPLRSPRRRCPGWIKAMLSSPEWMSIIAGGVFLLAGAIVHWSDGPQAWRIGLLGGAYLLCGWRSFLDALGTLWARSFDIDLLMIVAALGAGVLGHYEEGAMLLLLFALGGAGEELAMGRARHAISALTQLAPRTATRVQPDGALEEVAVEALQVGDRIMVHPGRRIAADGVVVEGASAVDQQAITGESIPVEKTLRDVVFAGTINGPGTLRVQVTQPATDHTLAKLIRMVEEAQASRSPTQRFTDQIEKWYVPAVLLVTLLLCVLPPGLGWTSRIDPEAPWAGWFYQAMAFLTAASPCALAIGTPAAVLSGIGKAARLGILIKGGAALENLARIRVVALDKTGTLTRGRPEVTHVIVLDAAVIDSEASLLAQAAAIEQGSRHPLAMAVVEEARQRELAIPLATQIHQTPGVGIRGQLGDAQIEIGRPTQQETHRWPAIVTCQQAGRTTILVRINQQAAGLIALADRPRATALAGVQALDRLGLAKVVMLTGDHEAVGKSIAREVGVREVAADLMPEDKLHHIQAYERTCGPVAMVGDGVNDAPAMACATLGVAMGVATNPSRTSAVTSQASDVALETADVVLMNDNLLRLADAIDLGRISRRVIAQNLWIALGVMSCVAPIAAMGLTNIALSVLLHEGSTVLVVLNGLRLLRMKP